MRHGRLAGRIVALSAGVAIAAPSLAFAGTAGPTLSLGTAGDFEYLKATFDEVVSSAGAPVDCSEGDTAAGGGGSISGSGANAALHASFPVDAAGSGWSALGRTSGQTGRRVVTFAICGPAAHTFDFGTSPMQPAGQLGDVVPVSDSCTEGQTALAGFEGEGDDVRVMASRPGASGDSWYTAFQNFDDEGGADGTQWRACESDYDTVVRRSDPVRINPGKARKAVARCKGGEAAIGGGFDSAPDGEAKTEVWGLASRPYDSKDAGKVPEDGWTAKAQNGRDKKVRLTSLALCAEQ